MDWVHQSIAQVFGSSSTGTADVGAAQAGLAQWLVSAMESNPITSYIANVGRSRPILSTVALASVAGYAALRRAMAGGVCTHREDLTGKVIVITGGHSGIGFETTKILAGMGKPIVILGMKNPDGQKDLIEQMQAQTENTNIRALKLDLADLESIKAFAEEVKSLHNHIDILIENAGVLQSQRRTTKNNFETSFGVNHLGHMYLAYQLLPLLRAAPTEARVVVLSSMAHKDAKINWEDLHWNNRKYDVGMAYAESKLANVLFVTELHRRLSSDPRSNHITVNAVHPGVIKTPIFRELDTYSRVITYIIFAIAGKTPVQGAQTTVHAAISPALHRSGGHYLADCVIDKQGKEVTVENGIRLWEISCNLLGIPTDW